LLPVARSSGLAAAAELATSLKQSSPKNAANPEPLKRALTGYNTNHPAAPNLGGATNNSAVFKGLVANTV